MGGSKQQESNPAPAARAGTSRKGNIKKPGKSRWLQEQVQMQAAWQKQLAEKV